MEEIKKKNEGIALLPVQLPLPLISRQDNQPHVTFPSPFLSSCHFPFFSSGSFFSRRRLLFLVYCGRSSSSSWKSSYYMELCDSFRSLVHSMARSSKRKGKHTVYWPEKRKARWTNTPSSMFDACRSNIIECERRHDSKSKCEPLSFGPKPFSWVFLIGDTLVITTVRSSPSD